MALTSSAKKAIKRSAFLRERNLTFKIAMKKSEKAVRKGVQGGVKGKEMDGLLQTAYSAIDKAARKNIIHRNTAARKKSRLTRLSAKAAA